MKETILVSVLIPTYNVEKYVEEAIQCIINQTYKNFEIIVVDDCSTDNTFSILEKIKIIEPRLKLFRKDNNSGIVKALNTGIKKCTGEYIMRMDGDDLCDINKIVRQLQFLLINPDIDLVGCDIYSIDEKGLILNKIETSHNVNCTNKILKWTCPVLHIWMCKKTVYTDLNGYRELGGSEDYDLLLRMNTMGMKFTNIPYYGYSVRIRDGNTQSLNGLKQRKIVYYIKKLYKERIISKCNIDSFNKVKVNKFIISFLFHEKIHRKSVKFTNQAMNFRMKNNNILFVFYALLSCISPYQFIFFIESTYSNYLLKKYN
tara:strand:- start:375 stop:1322 length:948 start_codon:yes stop_codon:yes gene_type:complete